MESLRPKSNHSLSKSALFQTYHVGYESVKAARQESATIKFFCKKNNNMKNISKNI